MDLIGINRKIEVSNRAAFEGCCDGERLAGGLIVPEVASQQFASVMAAKV